MSEQNDLKEATEIIEGMLDHRQVADCKCGKTAISFLARMKEREAERPEGVPELVYGVMNPANCSRYFTVETKFPTSIGDGWPWARFRFDGLVAPENEERR